MRNQEPPQTNASSMADIAFLLLIFFLVTATLQIDLGILKRLPSNQITGTKDMNQRNVLEISMNQNNEILLDGSQKIDPISLKKLLVDFIDNGTNCSYCSGKKDINSSDHPTAAILVLEPGRKTSYGTYVLLQNEINDAYNELRNKLAISLYGITFIELENSLTKNKNDSSLREKIKNIKDKYPMLISENYSEKNLNN